MALQRASQIFTKDEIQSLRRLSPTRATWLIVHCWGVIIATWVVAAIWTNPLTIAVGVVVIGARQLGLAILFHDGAHYTLFPNKRLNDWVSEWLLSRPLLSGTVTSYRTYHLTHHRHTQQEEDPDLHLSAPFPIRKASFKRKVVRDLTGQTGWKQYGDAIRAGFGDPADPWPERLRRARRRIGPNLLANAVIFAALSMAGVWYLYFLLWWLPALTWNRFITRIRNIGEHAAVPDDNDRLRNTRTVLANWLERAFIAPYYVNYHLEHHLLVSCPCYRLKDAHRVLVAKGLREQMEVQPGYPAMLRQAVLA